MCLVRPTLSPSLHTLFFTLLLLAFFFRLPPLFFPLLDTGISDLISFHEKVWFQNRRAKEKKVFTKKDSSPTPTSSIGGTTLSAATASTTSVPTDVSPSPEATPDVVADSVP